MIEAFKAIRFRPATRALIGHANGIIGEYQALGFTLTLRQLFYQFVARPALGLANTFDDYKRLGRTVTDARRAGLIDWAAIEDRTRNVHRLPTWDEPSEIVSSCSEQYREDAWASQPYRPEVWIEKDALTGVIEDVSNALRAPYFSCRGNVSEPEMYAAGKRFARVVRQGQVPIVLHLGDHDPNGVDMTRDIHERLKMFARQEIEVRRIALNLSQVTGLPPNFAKENDSRYAAYVRQFGTTDCWELDALAPNVISGLVRGSDRGRGRQPRRPGRRGGQLVLGQVCTEVGAMTKLTVTCESWKPLRKNTLRGFATVEIVEIGLTIHDVGVHESHGKFWAALPARPWVNGLEVLTDGAGKIRYAQLLEFPRKEIRDAFSQRVVEAVARFDPHALAASEGVA